MLFLEKINFVPDKKFDIRETVCHIKNWFWWWVMFCR